VIYHPIRLTKTFPPEKNQHPQLIS